jgi:hypothetical protein
MAPIIMVLGLSGVFSQDFTNLRDVQSAISDIAGEFAKSLTFNSVLGLNWSDAYIGQILNKPPEKLLNSPPHFGLGVMAGATTINKDRIVAALKKAGAEEGDFDTIPLIPLPAGAAEIRLGGFILPFDLGVKVGVVPSLTILDILFDYTFAGFDFRYALVREEAKGWKPNVSVGAGFNYIKGTLAHVSIGNNLDWGFTDPFSQARHEIFMSAPDLSVNWNNVTLDLKAQVSKRLIYVFTPYLGLGTSFGWSTVGCDITSQILYDGGPFDAAAINEVMGFLKTNGIPLDVDNTGFSMEEKDFSFGLRVYGGLSINMWKIILDITGLYSFLDQNYGASVGFRVQI